MPERITLTTADDLLIIGTWFPAPTVVGAAILLHMMPEERASWTPVQQALAKRGMASLAIDLRGHGESTKSADGDTFDYRTFKDEDHQSSILDVDAAVEWVESRGIELSRIALGGASIGANLAMLKLASEPQMPGAVLLSPGADYRGLRALEDVQNLLPEQRLVIIASEDDETSFTDSKKLYAEAPVATKTFVPYVHSGHGTNMLKADAALAEKIAGWFAEFVKT